MKKIFLHIKLYMGFYIWFCYLILFCTIDYIIRNIKKVVDYYGSNGPVYDLPSNGIPIEIGKFLEAVFFMLSVYIIFISCKFDQNSQKKRYLLLATQILFCLIAYVILVTIYSFGTNIDSI